MSKLLQMASTRLLWTMIVLAGIGAAVPTTLKSALMLQRNAKQWRGWRIPLLCRIYKQQQICGVTTTSYASLAAGL